MTSRLVDDININFEIMNNMKVKVNVNINLHKVIWALTFITMLMLFN